VVTFPRHPDTWALADAASTLAKTAVALRGYAPHPVLERVALRRRTLRTTLAASLARAPRTGDALLDRVLVASEPATMRRCVRCVHVPFPHRAAFVMLAVTQGLAGTAAGLHVVFFLFESVLFGRPKIQERFRVAPSVAEAVRPWAFNQGFYNLFLALGCFAGLLAVHGAIPGIDASAARALVLFPCACMVGAGVVLALTDRRMVRAAAAQAIPPLVAICLDLL
jgi:putative membrane protein